MYDPAYALYIQHSDKYFQSYPSQFWKDFKYTRNVRGYQSHMYYNDIEASDGNDNVELFASDYSSGTFNIPISNFNQKG